MIVLNYHRISESDPRRDFYTVTPADFSAHLEVLAGRGSRVTAPDDVLDGGADGDSVMLHFDDGTSDHYSTVAPLLVRHGFRGVFFVSTAKIGNDGYMNPVQIRELAAAGHTVECHGHSHRRMDRMSREELEDELACSVGEIHRLTGRRPRILAPPGGFLSRKVVEAAAGCGMHILRTMRWGDNPLPLRGTLDCLVVHHGVTAGTIAGWLDGKGLWGLRMRYLAKQLVRSAMPLEFYLALRRRFIRGKHPAN
ncbi:MAG: polysaccharide deacetylase family protein [Verrucomicrobiales bacterium]